MKKKFLFLGLCSTMAASMILTACGDPDGGITNSLSSPNDVYGMGAVSSVKLLGNSIPTNAIKSLSAVSASAFTNDSGIYTSAASSEEEVKAQSNEFNRYFTALDSFLGDEVVSTSTVANTDSDYDFETKMIITGKDINGETATYKMYYTETLANTESDDDSEETEGKYTLSGVMIIDNVDYYLEGKRSVETEKDETETELSIRAYADITDKTSYIQMEQEYSVEDGESETEYVYSIYANGELLEQTAVEFETENKNNKVETAYELEFRRGEAKGKYTLEREVKDKRTEIKVKYDIDGKTGVFHIREVTGDSGNKQYRYSYNDGSSLLFD